MSKCAVTSRGDRPCSRLISSALGLAALASMIGCASPPYDPFKTERTALREQVRTIALAPHPVGQLVMEPEEDATTLIEPETTRRLEAAGIEVIPSAVWSEIWRTAAQDLGGLYDPSTRKVNQEAFTLVREATHRTLAEVHGADAFLYVSVENVEFEMGSLSEINICGAEQVPYFPEPRSAESKRLRKFVTARGSCLEVALYDLDGEMLYGIRHGIELWETHAENTRARMPRMERLRDAEKLRAAFDATLDPLAQNHRPAP